MYTTDAIELNVIKLILNPRLSVQIVGMYRPPDRNIHDFNVALGNVLTSLPRSTHVYMVGDMNIDLLDSDPLMEEYCAILQSASYLPIITEPTRITDHSATLIDHIWTNQLHEAVSGVLEVTITDHYPTFLSTYLNIDLTDARMKKTFRDHSESSLDSMKRDLTHFMSNFGEILNLDFQTKSTMFSDNLYEIYNRNCKLRTKYISRTNFLKPWISNEIKRNKL